MFHQSRQDGTHTQNVFDIDMSLFVAPTPEQDLHVSIDLSSSDVTLIVNPLPLRSAFQCLVDFFQLPYQDGTDLSLGEEIGANAELSLGEDTVAKAERDNDTDMLSISVSAEISRIFILFLVDAQEMSRGLLQLAVNSIHVKSTSLGVEGELLVSNEPFILSAAQVTRVHPNPKGNCFDWRLLPFKPIVAITGTEIAVRSEMQQADSLGPLQIDIDIKMGVKSTELNVSPSTTAALLGAAESLSAALELQNNSNSEELSHEDKIMKDEMRSIQYQREALLRTFRIAGVTAVGILDEDDIEKLIRLNSNGQLTNKEIEREKDFICLLAGGSLTLDKINTMLFRVTNGIDDSNFASILQAAGIGCDSLPQCASFSSELSLHNLVYFDDLREYSAMHEVYRITGETKLYSTSRFPAPVLWHRGQGVDLFWDFYCSECGCLRESLCGQEMKIVQQKLVRSLW